MTDKKVIELSKGQSIEIGGASPVGMIFNIEVGVLGINFETGEVTLGVEQSAIPYTDEDEKRIRTQLDEIEKIAADTYQKPEGQNGPLHLVREPDDDGV